MKKIPYLASLELISIEGEPFKAPDGSIRQLSQLDFFLGRLSDPAFSENKEGLDAVSFVVVTRLELENQKQMAEERGFWLLEDDRASSLQRASLHPRTPYNMTFARTILPLAQSVETLESA